MLYGTKGRFVTLERSWLVYTCLGEQNKKHCLGSKIIMIITTRVAL